MIPFPTNEQVHEWFWFIVGFNRRKINKRSEPNANASNTTSAKGGFSPSRPAEGSRPKAIKPIRGASKGLKASVMPDEDDEEAFMNGPSLSVTNAKTLDSSNDIEGDPDDDDGDEDYDLDEDDEDDDHGNVYDHDIEMTNASNEEATRKKEEAKRSSFKYDLEPETAKHRPRAPTIGLLARLDQVSTLHRSLFTTHHPPSILTSTALPPRRVLSSAFGKDHEHRLYIAYNNNHPHPNRIQAQRPN